MVKTYGHFIDGKWVKSDSKETFPSRDPSNPHRILARFQKGTKNDVEKAVKAAEKAYPSWSEYPAPKRGEILLKIAAIMRKEKNSLARLMTKEMGKVLPETLGDVQEGIDIAEYMAGEGRRLFGHTTPSELKEKAAFTIRRPVGIVGLITPWNFPIAIPAWKIMPALICGNTIVFKPATDTPLLAAKLVEICTRAGVPKGVINFVTGGGSIVGEAIITHPKILAISFTGSIDTGKRITSVAGVKKVGLELGGKNAIIVMDDAKLDLAVEGILWGAFGTTGQRCTATSRVIVHKAVKKKLERMLVSRAKKIKLGSGLKKGTEVGPLINEAAVLKVDKYVRIGKKEGAKLLCGGKIPQRLGHYYEPTIFTNVKPGMRIAQEEIFGPYLSIIEVSNLNEAIKVANGVDYGLSVSIYTESIHNAFKSIDKIDAGLHYVNSSTVGSEVHLPFGGVKGTGNGTREGGIEGINEFSETKTIYIDYSGKLQKAQIDIVKK